MTRVGDRNGKRKRERESEKKKKKEGEKERKKRGFFIWETKVLCLVHENNTDDKKISPDSRKTYDILDIYNQTPDKSCVRTTHPR